jgi:hypothetical protein
MTAREIYDLALRGGGNDFQATVELLERLGEPWCLIGGLAVNAYAEPVYTADADFVIVASQLEFVCAELAGLGFTISHHFGVNAQLPGSSLIVQFTTQPDAQKTNSIYCGSRTPTRNICRSCRRRFEPGFNRAEKIRINEQRKQKTIAQPLPRRAARVSGR